jgi:hypothetical protein
MSDVRLLALLVITGLVGVGAMLVCISVQVEKSRQDVFRWLQDEGQREEKRGMYVIPPGYKAVEYHPDGKVKKVECA